MRNRIEGSEAEFVRHCQRSKAPCIDNSALLISDYDLIFLQELSSKEWSSFLEKVKVLGRQRGVDYQALVGYYFGDVMTAIIFNVAKLGRGLQITPSDFKLYDETTQDKEERSIVVGWFPDLGLIAINLHAPHKIDLRGAIERRLIETEPFLRRYQVEHHQINRVLMAGDFNDDFQEVTRPNFALGAYGHRLKLPIDSALVPQTCCFDSNYQYTGDYILDSRRVPGYFGVPHEYDRNYDLYSDHDPVVYFTTL